MSDARDAEATGRRLLFVVTDDWYFVSHRLDLARAAIAAGYTVGVATRVADHGSQITSAGCELIPLDWRRRGTTLLHEIATVAALRQAYRTFKPDFIHHVAMRPVLYGSIAARSVPDALVVNAIAGRGYVFTSTDFRARLLRPFLRAAMRFALGRRRTHVILQNPEDRALIAGTRPDRTNAVTIIRGAGVDPSAFAASPIPPGAPIVMLAARMLRSKGVPAFVDAARELRTAFPETRFVLVGDTDAGNYAAISREELTEWNASGVVEWWGHRADMPATLAQSHIVCLPSTSGEGVPKVLIEAAAVGRAIVATDVPGCREIVRNNVNGLLVGPGDARALASAIGLLLRDAPRVEKMGAASRSVAVNEFSIARVAAATLDVYRANTAR
ncbi:MAG TPA: glycosyltransferase family 4 protein [Gemmatimonadaceae bacterium]|nr:glycosyltransferase family 4 protein [Gemmatimonadaceae bacterium]